MATHEPIETADRGKYEPAWDRYRQLDQEYYGGMRWLFFIIGVAFVLHLVGDWLGPLPEIVKGLILLVAVPMLVAALIIACRMQVAWFRIWRFPCPRCGGRFNRYFYFTGMPARKCSYCGLFVCQARD